jgi:hypothetical protein
MGRTTWFILAAVVVIAVMAATWWRSHRVEREMRVANLADRMQPPPPGAPKDQVLSMPIEGDADHPEFKALMDRARSQLPEVRRRFRDGLPKGQSLFVTTLVKNPAGGGGGEQIFVQVVDWNDDQGPKGVIASEVRTPGLHYGDLTMVLDAAIRDWTISHPDGSEEGNALGKYIEEHRSAPRR